MTIKELSENFESAPSLENGTGSSISVVVTASLDTDGNVIFDVTPDPVPVQNAMTRINYNLIDNTGKNVTFSGFQITIDSQRQISEVLTTPNRIGMIDIADAAATIIWTFYTQDGSGARAAVDPQILNQPVPPSRRHHG